MLFERLRFLEKVPSERQSVSNIETNEKTLLSEDNSEESCEVSNSANLDKRGTTEKSDGETSRAGTKETTRSSVGRSRVGTKRKQESITQGAVLQYLKERDKGRLAEIRALTVEREEDDVDGIHSFCSHIESILKKLTPALRVEAKTKIFNITTDYELQCINQASTTSTFIPQSNEIYSVSSFSPNEMYNSSSNPYSPISVASPIQPTDFISIPLTTDNQSPAPFDSDTDNAGQSNHELTNNYFLTSM